MIEEMVRPAIAVAVEPKRERRGRPARAVGRLANDMGALLWYLDAYGRLDITAPDPPCADPRPDLAADHEQWGALLELAYRLDHESDVLGVLYGARSGGARLRPAVQGSLRIDQGDYSSEEWADLRAAWLQPNRQVITRLLADLSCLPVSAAG